MISKHKSSYIYLKIRSNSSIASSVPGGVRELWELLISRTSSPQPPPPVTNSYGRIRYAQIPLTRQISNNRSCCGSFISMPRTLKCSFRGTGLLTLTFTVPGMSFSPVAFIRRVKCLTPRLSTRPVRIIIDFALLEVAPKRPFRQIRQSTEKSRSSAKTIGAQTARLPRSHPSRTLARDGYPHSG